MMHVDNYLISTFNFPNKNSLLLKILSIFYGRCRALKEVQSGLMAKWFFSGTLFVPRSVLFDKIPTKIRCKYM
jgi:hypothetical protein